jgi:hypothetical protein
MGAESDSNLLPAAVRISFFDMRLCRAGELAGFASQNSSDPVMAMAGIARNSKYRRTVFHSSRTSPTPRRGSIESPCLPASTRCEHSQRPTSTIASLPFNPAAPSTGIYPVASIYAL